LKDLEGDLRFLRFEGSREDLEGFGGFDKIGRFEGFEG
jgi:hypothetical protein